MLIRVRFQKKKISNFSDTLQPLSPRDDMFDLFDKPNFDYNDNQTYIEIESENDVLDDYEHC